MNVRIKVPRVVETKPMMHKVPCVNCPSMLPPDDEVKDILKLDHSERVLTAFACGWRPSKYCKGYCDQMGITNEDLNIEKPKV